MNLNDKIIESRLARQMTGSWPIMTDNMKLACVIAYTIGYDDGFQVACAAERGIAAVQSKIEEMEQADPATLTSEGLAATQQPGAGSSLDKVIDVLASIPGSGYTKSE